MGTNIKFRLSIKIKFKKGQSEIERNTDMVYVFVLVHRAHLYRRGDLESSRLSFKFLSSIVDKITSPVMPCSTMIQIYTINRVEQTSPQEGKQAPTITSRAASQFLALAAAQPAGLNFNFLALRGLFQVSSHSPSSNNTTMTCVWSQVVRSGGN